MTEEAVETTQEQTSEEAVDVTAHQAKGNAEEDKQEASKVDQDLERAKEEGVDYQEFERTRKALAKANKEAQERRQKLAEWDRLNVSPEKVESLLQEQKEAEIKKAEEEGRYHELMDKMRQQMSEKEQQADEKVSQMEQKLRNQLHEKELRNALLEAEAIPDLLDHKLRQRTEMVEQDGQYKTVVLDEDGQPTDMKVKDLLKEWKEHPELGHAFKAPKISGAGTSSESASKASNAGRPKQQRSKMSTSEKLAYQNKHGIEQYQKLPF